MYGTVTPEALRGMFAAMPPHPTDEEQSGSGQPGKQIFDLTQVPYMDSAGLGMLASQLARCQAAGVRLVLAGVSARVLELLRMTKLDGLIPMAATLDEAKAQ
jgi:anti-sigma B factor antagonist